MIHPTISFFEQQAAMLEAQQSTMGLDDAIAKLAAWMDLADLSGNDWAVFGEVGGILYREGLRRRQE